MQGMAYGTEANSDALARSGQIMRSQQIFLTALCTTLIILSTRALSGAHFGPAPDLAHHWEFSDCVAEAEVLSVRNKKHHRPATLKILKTFKNTTDENSEEIVVLTEDPRFHRFKKNKRVIVFLEFNADTQEFKQKYAFNVSEQGGIIFGRMFEKLPVIMQSPYGSPERIQKLLDWYVECASHRESRGQGAYGISYLQFKSDAESDLLSMKQKDQLVKIVTSEVPPKAVDASLAGILFDYPSPELDAYLMESLRRCYEPGWTEITDFGVRHMHQRLNIKRSPIIIKLQEDHDHLFDTVYNELESDKSKQALYRKEKARLDILWGVLCTRVYEECKEALDSNKRVPNN